MLAMNNENPASSEARLRTWAARKNPMMALKYPCRKRKRSLAELAFLRCNIQATAPFPVQPLDIEAVRQPTLSRLASDLYQPAITVMVFNLTCGDRMSKAFAIDCGGWPIKTNNQRVPLLHRY